MLTISPGAAGRSRVPDRAKIWRRVRRHGVIGDLFVQVFSLRDLDKISLNILGSAIADQKLQRTLDLTGRPWHRLHNPAFAE
jgi:hypothetical protein